MIHLSSFVERDGQQINIKDLAVPELPKKEHLFDPRKEIDEQLWVKLVEWVKDHRSSADAVEVAYNLGLLFPERKQQLLLDWNLLTTPYFGAMAEKDYQSLSSLEYLELQAAK